MAQYYGNIANVDISINTVALTQDGFGAPLFISDFSHKPVEGISRVFAISDKDELLDEGFTTDSPAYRAATTFFAQTPSPSLMYIGRRAPNRTISLLGNEQDIAAGDQFGFTINDANLGSLPVAYTAVGGETFQDIINAFNAQIAASDLAVYLGTNTTSTSITVFSTLQGIDEIYFVIESLVNTSADITLELTSASTESAANALAAIRDENDDFYFVTSESHQQTFVQQLGVQVNALNKMHFYSTSNVAELQPYNPDSITGIMDFLQFSNITRSVGLFHQDDTLIYPELGYIGFNAPYDAGSVTWSNLQINGASPSTNPANGRVLSTSQKQNLASRNGNYMVTEGGSAAFVRNGYTATNEWIDTIRGVDWLESDMTNALRRLLLGQQGTKLPYTDQGTAQVREVVSSSLQRAVNRDFLVDFSVSIPLVSTMSLQDRQDRILRDVKFSGILAGAIHTIEVAGSVDLA